MKRLLCLLICLLLCPMLVSASVACNDGSIDITCDTCEEGCCSGHKLCGDLTENKELVDYEEQLDNAKICYFVFGTVTGILGTCLYIYFRRKKK